MNGIFLWLSLSLFPFISTADEGAARTLVIVGDSLTEGYGVAREKAFPALLEKKLVAKTPKAKWKVINAGVSGATSASCVERTKWHLKSKPEIILIALGANDALRGLKTEKTQASLDECIILAQKEKAKVILAGMLSPPNYGSGYTDRFRRIFPALAKKYKITLIPFLLDGVAGEKSLNQADGIHPNEKGHEVIAETVFKAIESDLN